MPRLTRSTNLTSALVFGFLSVLTSMGVSSGGLKAGTTVLPAADTIAVSHKDILSLARAGTGSYRLSANDSPFHSPSPRFRVAEVVLPRTNKCKTRCLAQLRVCLSQKYPRLKDFSYEEQRTALMIGCERRAATCVMKC